MQHGPPRRRRARPVADAPLDALLVGVEDLAKGWLLALLEQAPLEEAPGIMSVDLTRDGPRICDAVVRALADDTDLRRLEPGGALEPLASRVADIAGSDGPETTARAVDALQAVIWAALRAELPWPDPDQIAQLAERLALVCEILRAAALRRSMSLPETIDRRSGGRPEPRGAPALRVTRLDEPRPVAEAVPQAPPEAPEPQPAVRGAPDPAARQARSQLDPLWVNAIEDEIRQAERSGTPLSLLLAELEDGERVSAVEPRSESGATFSRFAQAVRGAVRREDLLACETDTRAWIIARETSRSGAHALANRIASAVEEAPAWRGAPLRVNVGLAVLGEDGRDAATLIEAAEEAKFAAAASGLRVMPPEPSGGDAPAAG